MTSKRRFQRLEISIRQQQLSCENFLTWNEIQILLVQIEGKQQHSVKIL